MNAFFKRPDSIDPLTKTLVPYMHLYRSLSLTPSRATITRAMRLRVIPTIFRPVARTLTSQSGSFRDRVTIDVRAGAGGSGCLSFTRAPNQIVAPPDGGNGGDGGSIWLRACLSMRSLTLPVLHRAGVGTTGRPAKRRGASASDLIIDVPCGTVVRTVPIPGHTDMSLQIKQDAYGQIDLEGEETQKIEEDFLQEDSGQLVAELNVDGEKILVAQGGRGGRGNAVFRNSRNRSPTTADPGAPGEERRFELELKTIADVGLVGFPNAGKSTLLRAVSRARPKVASYPFTTIRPHLGVVHQILPDGSVGFGRMTIADIPGIIEGAHENRGLGHEFLRHVERTTVLVYVIDVAGVEGLDAGKDVGKNAARVLSELETLQLELDLHQEGLTKRQSCIVANKMDAGEAAMSNLLALVDAVGDDMPIFPVSAKHGTGVVEVVKHLSASLPRLQMTSPEDSSQQPIEDGLPSS